ncbi:unnamed protein product [Dovyalis caffra]|uniref:Uncharacterized protein n=1 Tax=Dovyalis caffra TaxID=77055 RepID=A0AAV1QSS4_9ROSI|nr:unnamed protein product [Dovyalis caffra]
MIRATSKTFQELRKPKYQRVHATLEKSQEIKAMHVTSHTIYEEYLSWNFFTGSTRSNSIHAKHRVDSSIVVKYEGVTSMALGGAAKDQIVVIGEEVDSVKLGKSLRKKVGNANIMSVEEEKDKGKDEKDKGKDKGKDEKEKEKYPWQLTPYPVPYYYSQPLMCEVVCDSNPSNCSIL